MASQINVCTPFSHCEKTKTSMQVLLLLCFVLFAPACVCVQHLHMCVYLDAAVVKQLPGLIII